MEDSGDQLRPGQHVGQHRCTRVGIPGNRDTTVISDVLPAGASFGTLPANCRSGPGPSAVTCFDIPGVVTAQNPSGSSSNFVEIPVTLAVPSGALAGTCYTNSASIDAQRPPLPGGDVRPNDATANSVCVVADTGLTKTSSSGTVQRGGSVDFTLTLTAYSPLPNGAIPTIIDTGLQSLPPGTACRQPRLLALQRVPVVPKGPCRWCSAPARWPPVRR